MNVHKPGASWRLQVFSDCPAIYTSKPPSWFHRLLQKWLLGFRWSKED